MAKKKKKFNPNAITSQAEAKELVSMMIVPEGEELLYVSPTGKIYASKEIAELREGKGNLFTVKNS